jgi:tripartite-type tricarboxylate transporter receptor subunit TctC
MKRLFISAATLLFAGTVLAQATSTGSGQAYPSKPIKFVVPFSAGSATDIVARTVGDAMGKSMGQHRPREQQRGCRDE